MCLGINPTELGGPFEIPGSEPVLAEFKVNAVLVVLSQDKN